MLLSDRSDTEPDACYICSQRAVELHMRILPRDAYSWLVCPEHVKYSRKVDAELPKEYQARFLYHRILYPDTCTPEEVICIEIILTRWIDFLYACVVSSSGP